MEKYDNVAKYIPEDYKKYFDTTLNLLPKNLKQSAINVIYSNQNLYQVYDVYDKLFNKKDIVDVLININKGLEISRAVVHQSLSIPLVLLNKIKKFNFLIKLNFEFVNKIESVELSPSIPALEGFVPKYYDKSNSEQLIIYSLIPLFSTIYGSIYIYMNSYKHVLKDFKFDECIELYENQIYNENQRMVSNWLCTNRNNYMKYKINDILYINISLQGDFLFSDYINSIKIYAYSTTRQIKIILFSILITLDSITTVYPNFRHNDLHMGNIILLGNTKYLKNNKDARWICQWQEIQHYLGDYTPFLIDFNQSELPELGIYNKGVKSIVDKNILFDDIFYLLHSIYIASRNTYSVLLDELLNEIDPTSSYIHLDITYTINKYGKKPTMKDIMKKPIWDDIIFKEKT